MAAEVRVEMPVAHVQWVTVASPGRKNALTGQHLQQLAAILAGVAPRARVVCGDGEAFCAGSDLHELAARAADAPLPDVQLDAVCEALALSCPSVAAVDGPAFGAGCELALSCDFRIATHRATFCMPPAKLGVVYSLGGLRRVVEKVGERTARRLFLLAEPIMSTEALALGLVDEVCSVDDLKSRALAMAEKLVALAPRALLGLKQGLRFASQGATDEQKGLFEQLRQAAFNGSEAHEGIRAALERRAPKF